MPNLHPSENAFALARKFEGLRLSVYNDPSSLPTIGYGHRLTHEEAASIHTITQDEAESLLASDMEIAARAVNDAGDFACNQNQFDALCAFVFNLGGARFVNSSLLDHLESGNYEQAADDLLLWCHAHAGIRLVELPGLFARRTAERELFLSGTVPNK